MQRQFARSFKPGHMVDATARSTREKHHETPLLKEIPVKFSVWEDIIKLSSTQNDSFLIVPSTFPRVTSKRSNPSCSIGVIISSREPWLGARSNNTTIGTTRSSFSIVFNPEIWWKIPSSHVGAYTKCDSTRTGWDFSTEDETTKRRSQSVWIVETPEI